MNYSRCTRAICRAIMSLSFVLLVFSAVWGEGVQVSNTATYAGSGRYDWTVFLVGDSAVLDRVRYVEYTLHPSFPRPIRRSDDRRSGFALSANGWGEFNIMTRVVFHDSRVSDLPPYWLKLRKVPELQLVVPAVRREHGVITTKNTAEPAERGRREWAVFIVSDERTLSEVECVEYALHPTFPDPIRKVCQRGDDPERPFVLRVNGWGTFTIEIKVLFKDGETRHLRHQLRF